MIGDSSLTAHQEASTVLLHNTNKCLSIPLAHSVQIKENYENVIILLSALKYVQYSWVVIGDFKMTAFLMGLQRNFTKFPCYLFLRDSRNTFLHCKKKNWPLLGPATILELMNTPKTTIAA